MTIVFCGATKNYIVMTVDSVVTRESGQQREYLTESKVTSFQGTGCVSTWGARNGNHMSAHLHARVRNGAMKVTDLADIVLKYLIDEYKAHDEPISEDIGYHVAGFDSQGKAHLYHIFWGIPRPNLEQRKQDYNISDHSPSHEQPIQLLYNGRNDIANSVIQLLIQAIKQGKDMEFNIMTAVGMAQLGYFIARRAAEITQEVGPPFYTFIISPENKITRLKNEQWKPLSHKELANRVKKLGVSPVARTMRELSPSDIDLPNNIATDNSPISTAGTITSFLLKENTRTK